MDIVYTLSNNYTGEELKYSLRSLQNIPHDRVFFVGGCPRGYKNIIHIQTEQTGTKWENVPRNLIKACQDERLSANFILMNDDFFIIEPIKTPTKELNLYNGTLQGQYNKLLEKNGCPTNYMRGLAETKALIQTQGVADPLSYELHVPFIFNKKKYLKLFEIPGIEKLNCLQIRSLFGNLHLKGGTSQKDVKIFLRNGFVPKHVGKFLSCDDAGFYILFNFLFTRFPNKSIYEI